MPQIFPFAQFTKSPRRHARQVPSCPPCQPTPTRWPFCHSFTPEPSSSITPATSCPGTRGYVKTFLRHHIAVTDTTGLHLNPHLSRARLRYFALYEIKVRSRLWHLHDFHFCHLSSPLISIQWNRGILSSSERNLANVDGDDRHHMDASDDSRVHRWQSRLHS